MIFEFGLVSCSKQALSLRLTWGPFLSVGEQVKWYAFRLTKPCSTSQQS